MPTRVLFSGERAQQVDSAGPQNNCYSGAEHWVLDHPGEMNPSLGGQRLLGKFSWRSGCILETQRSLSDCQTQANQNLLGLFIKPLKQWFLKEEN